MNYYYMYIFRLMLMMFSSVTLKYIAGFSVFHFVVAMFGKMTSVRGLGSNVTNSIWWLYFNERNPSNKVIVRSFCGHTTQHCFPQILKN